ncbi:hypothetical protein C8Q80DRAFT_1272898 [Daedaleopsis nitida]|nr:hypothetical protein C8Q80DRAFT_1272898 [Daedaleopsis nitida]
MTPHPSDSPARTEDSSSHERGHDSSGVAQFAQKLEKNPYAQMLCSNDAKKAYKAVTTVVTRSAFVANSEILLRALDDVAKIHPFIQFAYVLFKGVISLELAREENNEKVNTLMVTMSDMMGVLTGLESIPKDHYASSRSIKERLSERMQGIIDSIKACGKLCDTYRKSRATSKFFMSLQWKSEFTETVELFTAHKVTLSFDLQLHQTAMLSCLATAMDEEAARSQEIEKSMQEMKAMMKTLMKTVFEDMQTFEEREFKAVIGRVMPRDTAFNDNLEAALNDKAIVLKVLQKEIELIRNSGSSGRDGQNMRDGRVVKNRLGRKSGEDVIKDLDDEDYLFQRLQQEIKKGVAGAIKDNEDFDHKLGAIHSSILHAIEAGPHERVDHSDLQNLWKDMGWKGSVKAKHFAIGLRDHLVQHARTPDSLDLQVANPSVIRDSTSAAVFTSIPPSVVNSDHWALQHLTVTRMQSFISTTSELESRPLGSILDIRCRDVRALVFSPRPEPAVSDFKRSLQNLARKPKRLVNTQDWDYVDWDDDPTFHKFHEYVSEIEGRIEKGLVELRYSIDDDSALKVIGQG